MLNCLSFDIEGFIESNVQSFHIEEKYLNRKEEKYEIEKNMDFILELLGETECKATFFFLDSVVRDLPQMVKRVADLDHEIGLHGPDHIRIYDLERSTFKSRIVESKQRLEDLTSVKVHGYRAPDFSVTEASIWALDILKESGFTYDSSIYPFGYHDVYGIEGAETSIHKLSNGLIEFPPSTVEVFGKTLPFGGGGYFRLYPLFLTRYFLNKINAAGVPGMVFLHPYEVGPIIPRIENISYFRKFRHYYNSDKGYSRLKNLIENYKFTTALEVIKEHGLMQAD